MIELFSVKKYWEGFEETQGERVANLLPDATPGDLGLNPFGLKAGTPDFISMRTKELNNGRLAILATAGIVAQELVTGLPASDILDLLPF